MHRGFRSSGGNSVSSSLLLPSEPTVASEGVVRKRRDGRRGCLRLPLGAGGCRVCACDELDPGPRRRLPGVEEAALECFSWKKVPATHRPASPEAEGVVAAAAVEASLLVLPDDVVEMVLCRLPLASLAAARCVCRRWRDLTAAPQFLRVRREGPHRTPWLFLFGVGVGDGCDFVHALDVAAHRWRRIGTSALKGRFLFSVAGVGDEVYVVGGRSRGSEAGLAKTHKGVLVYSPLTGSWRKVASMRTARSRPVLGAFEISDGCSVLRPRDERHARRANASSKSRLGVASDVYQDPHRLTVRRRRLKDVLREDAGSSMFGLGRDKYLRQEGMAAAQRKVALIAVGGRGSWDEPLLSGEVYDPATDQWVDIAGLPVDVGLACSGTACGQMFYVFCDSDALVAYHLEKGFWVVVQTSRPPPRLRDYTPALVCCASRLFMLCVSWCDGDGPVNRREKVVRKLFELDLSSSKWTEACGHPDAPMDPNAAFAAGQDRIYAVEMFRIFGKVLDFVTACRVSDTEQRWRRIDRRNVAPEADALSCRLKSMAVLRL